MTTKPAKTLSPLTARVLKDLEPLAQAARCINDDDWGSDRQIDAQNKFFNKIKKILRKDDFAELEVYCLKATTDEMIDEALSYVRAIG